MVAKLSKTSQKFQKMRATIRNLYDHVAIGCMQRTVYNTHTHTVLVQDVARYLATIVFYYMHEPSNACGRFHNNASVGEMSECITRWHKKRKGKNVLVTKTN